MRWFDVVVWTNVGANDYSPLRVWYYVYDWLCDVYRHGFSGISICVSAICMQSFVGAIKSLGAVGAVRAVGAVGAVGANNYSPLRIVVL
ncbi:MAG: hypothetical protein CVV49_16675 [Spirochaetae bacterium HGW-Spirochaetae-5]|nr:MAG: hypothetical protein CVV49_16675 [Spirochaetae bacterium HGW-Spirochaetae-5]